MNSCYKLVLVEDEAPIRRSLCKKVEEFPDSFLITGVFKNGMQALQHIQTTPPDALITDIRMPVMDGLQLARSARKISSSLQIVIVSGYSDFEYAREAIAYQVLDYLTKPLSREDLFRVLNLLKAKLDRQNPDYSRKAEELVSHGAGKTLTRKVLLYLNEHFTEHLSISDISDHFGVGVEQLSRTFKKEEGVSPQQFLIQLKIEKACKILLCYDELDIHSVGALVGYPDPYYFSRIFKKYTDLSPKEYRKRNLKSASS